MSQSQEYSDEVADALIFIERAVVDGLKHGHFDISISCCIGNKKQRDLVVTAGNKHKFTIAADKIPK